MNLILSNYLHGETKATDSFSGNTTTSAIDRLRNWCDRYIVHYLVDCNSGQTRWAMLKIRSNHDFYLVDIAHPKVIENDAKYFGELINLGL